MQKKVIPIILVVLVVLGVGYFSSQRSNKDAPYSQANSVPETNGTTLDLSGHQLATWPESDLNRPDIKVLNLSNNQLTSLPASISKLSSLEVLNVENNRLVSLPPEINQLTNLREIRANNNRMTSLPAELGTMTWLKVLDISGNNITTDEIAQLKARLPNTQIKT